MSTDNRLKGEWSLRIARRLLDANAITRVIEPAIEDLRHEAVAARGAMRSLLVSARGYWGLWKAIVLCAAVESSHRRAADTGWDPCFAWWLACQSS